ncbi:MAG: sulfite exporter TauE/SafE family protein [Burkholderiales bacterium]|nr:sulfite exporter TauE/SafE family protein [Burkholderiales bacterium]
MQATFGFGFAILAAPLFLVVMESTGAIPVLAVLNLAVSAFVCAQTWRRAPVRLLGLLCAASVAGFPIGLALFRGADVSALKLAAGLVIMVFALLLLGRERGYILASRRAVDASRLCAPIALLAGALSGVMGAALAMPGPIAMLYLSAARLPKDQSRALSLAFFSFVYAAVCLLHAWDGGLSRERLWLSAQLMIAVLAGALAGQRLARHIPEARFRQLVLVILFIAGLYAVVSV